MTKSPFYDKTKAEEETLANVILSMVFFATLFFFLWVV